MNQLDQLKQHTVIVADSGDIDSILQYQPQTLRLSTKPRSFRSTVHC